METFLIVLAFFSTGIAAIATKPSATEVVVGGSTFLNFSNDYSQKISCFRTQFGLTVENFIYRNDVFLPTLDDRFNMERNEANGAYKMVISNAKTTDAGIYRCQEATAQGSNETAQLIVLESDPVCEPQMDTLEIIGPNKCGIEPNQLVLSCTVTYHGNEAPVMTWLRISDNLPVSEGVTYGTIDNRVVYTLTIKGNSNVKDGDSYFCNTTSATSNVGCKSGKIKITGTVYHIVHVYPTSAIIVIIVVPIGVIVLSAIVGWLSVRRRINSKASSPKNHAPEQIELVQVQDSVTEDMNILRAENERLTEKVAELEQRLYSTNNAPYRTTSRPNYVHTIKTQAETAPVTGIAILESHLFVASMNYPDIEVYDAETFAFERFIENRQFTNILDIASSKDIQCLYVINRQIDQSQCDIIRLSISGERGKCWTTENDNGRLSTYDSNLIVCFSTKRIIIEYSPESEVKNIVRLSPSTGFDQLWHALKLTSTNFAVSHSKTDKQQRVCVVDNHGTVLMSFEESPMMVCLVWDRDKYLLVTDSNNKRVLLLGSNLTYEGVLLKTDNSPVRLCLNEAKNRVLVGVNCLDKKQLAWGSGQILIYNVTKEQ